MAGWDPFEEHTEDPSEDSVPSRPLSGLALLGLGQADEPLSHATADGQPAGAPQPLSRREARERAGRGARRGRGRRGASAAPAPKAKAKGARPSLRRRLGSGLVSIGVLSFVASMIIALSVPSNVFPTEGSHAAPISAGSVQFDTQSLDVAALAPTEVPVSRDGFAVISYADLLAQRYGKRDYSYTVYNYGPVRWPFPYAVPITDGFGDRVAPCRGCSTYHEGDDFVPGAGAPIYAIADGVVSVHEVSSWGYGNHIEIEHTIGGQKITSLYAHMQLGSSPLKVGDHITVGDFVGLVGSTGAATGPHLHFELHVDGTPVDPFPWLIAHNKK